jgi:hypothetical protein
MPPSPETDPAADDLRHAETLLLRWVSWPDDRPNDAVVTESLYRACDGRVVHVNTRTYPAARSNDQFRLTVEFHTAEETVANPG